MFASTRVGYLEDRRETCGRGVQEIWLCRALEPLRSILIQRDLVLPMALLAKKIFPTLEIRNGAGCKVIIHYDVAFASRSVALPTPLSPTRSWTNPLFPASPCSPSPLTSSDSTAY